MQPVLQILGTPHYWEDRASAVKRLAKALPEPALRRQLLMFAEQDRAIADAIKQFAERQG